MKTIICCVRHGQTNGNKSRTFQGRSDLPLNEIGIEQANQTADLLTKCPIKWDLIISSPFIRAFETCQIIADKIDYGAILLNDAI